MQLYHCRSPIDRIASIGVVVSVMWLRLWTDAQRFLNLLTCSTRLVTTNAFSQSWVYLADSPDLRGKLLMVHQCAELQTTVNNYDRRFFPTWCSWPTPPS